jgi:hypothetical protein
MKAIYFSLIGIIILQGAWAQQKEGKVTYSRTMQMQMRINDNDQLQKMLPKTRTDKFELTFGNNQSLWKHVDEDDNMDEVSGNGMQIRMMAPGQNDVVFYDFASGRRIEQTEIMEKKFIISDSVLNLTGK